MTDRYTLYGAEISYYTAKVRAYLRWKGLPFDEVVADAGVYKHVILPAVGVRVIPVLKTPEGEVLQDSSDIIDALEARHPTPAVYPATPVQKLLALWIECVADEWLLIPAMHYRWHHDAEWAVAQFGAVNAPHATPEEQAAIGRQIAGPFAKAADMLGALPHACAAVEASYEGLLRELDAHFAASPALLGARPWLADFGLVGPLYAHQYRDPTAGALMHRIAPHVVRWVEQVQRTPQTLQGELHGDDAIPRTLLPALQRWSREFVPVLRDTAVRVAAWVAEHPGEALPRALGKHAFTLEGVASERVVRPYSLWMWQRVSDHLHRLQGAEHARAIDALQAIGAGDLLDMAELPRLVREGLTVRPVHND